MWWRHPTEAHLMDLIEGQATSAVREHVDACERCRLRVEQAQDALRGAVEAEVPEPSPFYWEAFRRQLNQRIHGASRRTTWRWRPVSALAAAALLAALVGILPRSVHRAEPLLPAWTALPPVEQDQSLVELEGILPALSDATLNDDCSGLTDCWLGLTDDERLALQDQLRQEVEGRKS